MSTPDEDPDALRFLLDENVSPKIVSMLWIDQIDAVALRDRAKTRLADHSVFGWGLRDCRAIITINEADFQRLAKRYETHPGLVSIPSGGSRIEQAEYIYAAAKWARRHPNAMQALKDRLLVVRQDMTITSHGCCRAANGGVAYFLDKRRRS